MAIEQLRNLLIIALCVVGFLLWQAWRQDYGPKPSAPRVVEQPAEPGAPDAPARIADVPSAPDLPIADEAPAPTSADPRGAVAQRDDRVRVRTDLLYVEIDPVGGVVSRVDLLAYPVSLNERDNPFPLFSATPPDMLIAQTGLSGQPAAPTHTDTFVPEAQSYVLDAGSDEIAVRLRWTGAEGIRVTKVYTFRRDSYIVDIRHHIENASSQPWTGQMYAQFRRRPVPPKGGLFTTTGYTYTGGVISTPDKPYEKVDFDDLTQQKLERQSRGGWAAMIQHYFAAAWVPEQEAEVLLYGRALGDGQYQFGMWLPPVRVAAGSSDDLSVRLYAGPKIQRRLQEIAPHLERTVDYGWLWMIAEPLFWVLDWIHGVVGNWGWSIILLTMLIKLLFFHLSATSYKSMARMRKLQPRITALRDRYASDKQRMNQAMMELYKQEKINPLGGCLPIVVQIPVFIALYWVLLESIELRQASFVLWLRDLSVHDPFFVLPIMMGITMLIQQRLNPAPPDPLQAKIMMALPFVFTMLFLFFPAGLVLYWFVNNVLSIIQQWVITKKIVGTA